MVVLRFASHCIAIALLIGSIAGDGGGGKGGSEHLLNTTLGNGS